MSKKIKENWIQWKGDLDGVRQFFKPGECDMPRALLFRVRDNGSLRITKPGPIIMVEKGQWLSRDLEVRDHV